MTDHLIKYGAKKVGTGILNKQTAKHADPTRYNGPESTNEFYLDNKHRERRKDVAYYTDTYGIPRHDAEILVAVKKRARRLDAGVSLCGFRAGYGAALALVPGIGDCGDLALSYTLIYRKANKVTSGKDLWAVRAVMVRNMGIGFAVGAFPVLGAGGLAVIKCNWRSAKALEEMLIKRADIEHGRVKEKSRSRSRGASRTRTGIAANDTRAITSTKSRTNTRNHNHHDRHDQQMVQQRRYVTADDLARSATSSDSGESAPALPKRKTSRSGRF